ncbi:MAG: DUF3795 domain-containing protein [Candidatus Bathyarchaeia archaeon]
MAAEKSGKWLISVCGLNCAVCDIYQAGHGNEKARDEIVEWFKKEHHKTIKPEQVNCEGCKGSLKVHWSPECDLLLCARKRAVQYCFQCEDFVCEKLGEFSSDGVPHHRKTVENLKRMKEMGLEAWIKEQERMDKHVFCP